MAVRAWNGREFEESMVTRYRRVNHVWTAEMQVPATSRERERVGDPLPHGRGS